MHGATGNGETNKVMERAFRRAPDVARGNIMKIKYFALPAFAMIVAALLFMYSRQSSASGWSGAGQLSAPPAARTQPATDGANLAEIQWQTVVNNSYLMPNGKTNFSSYSQPSINSHGMVVFRARSTGGQRDTGIYMRKGMGGKLVHVADINTLVPYPNNLNAEFLEFSAIARIAPNTDSLAFIGLHKPVYRYTLPDGSETRAGTAGIYALLDSDLLITGASKLGNAPDFEYFAVPGTKDVPFDIYPGAPALTDDGIIVFKGNYQLNGEGKTGIFYRRLYNTPAGGPEPVEMIANSDMDIPGMPPSFRGVTFDSTAPPSVYGNRLMFLGLDNEDDPHFGGIFTAFIKGGADLEEVIGIGDVPPGLEGNVGGLTRIGEGLSYDGRFLGFWGAWGKESKRIRLYCPTDGNPDIIEYCNGVDPLSLWDEYAERWYQDREVPVNQGIFLYDTFMNRAYLASRTSEDFADFLFWVYSGKVPGPGGGSDTDAEPPRWRSSAFVAVSNGLVVFKARNGYLDKGGAYFNPIDGLYLADPMNPKPLEALAVMGMDGAQFDAQLTPGSMPVTGVGIEREGFRGDRLAITLTMANEEAGWGGIYVATLRGNQPAKLVSEEKEKVLLPSLKKAKRQ